jgi:hypothetical protein
MIKKQAYYSGTLRITNPKTIERWKQNGEYNALINQGFIYSIGCGRFRTEICKCSKCKKNQTNGTTKN